MIGKNGAATTYQGVGGAVISGAVVDDSGAHGDLPENGIFGWKKLKRISSVPDGLSNTFALAEFVHRDKGVGSAFAGRTGKCEGMDSGRE